MSSKQERKAAAAKNTEARDRLEKLAKNQARRGVKNENDRYRYQNDQVIESEKNLPWWKR